MSTREKPEVREEEILAACEKLYERMNFRDVTLKEIGARTSFSRPSIYNYFQSKEEIFLRLFEREYLLWCGELEAIAEGSVAAAELPEKLARSLENRPLMLKLLADNIYGSLYAIEENSREERLVSFEKAYGKSILLIDLILKKAFPERSELQRKKTRGVVLEFLQGIYSYASVTQKQIEMMRLAGIEFEQRSIYELALDGFEIILK